MPTPSTANLPIPKDWNEFEDICADLFSKEWGDRNATRNGRQGQRQNGVDISGSPATGGLAGVQCKGKRSWPPKQLTTAEIDIEVAEAKKFQPPLSEFTIATAAPDDAPLQEYVRKISQRHKQQGLFTIHIAGWGELTRRLTQHDPLVEKHFNFVGLSSVRDQIAATPKETAKLVVDQLREVGVIPAAATAPATSNIKVEKGLAAGVSQALDRDLAERYRKALQRQPFPEVSKVNEFAPIANEVLGGGLSAAGATIRRRVLLRAARADAIYGAIPEAETFLAAAKSVPAEDSTLPAEARILEPDRLLRRLLLRLLKPAPSLEGWRHDCCRELVALTQRLWLVQGPVLQERQRPPFRLRPQAALGVGQETRQVRACLLHEPEG
jgi:hypothetical protein